MIILDVRQKVESYKIKVILITFLNAMFLGTSLLPFEYIFYKNYFNHNMFIAFKAGRFLKVNANMIVTQEV